MLKQPMLILFFFLYSDRVTSPFCSFCVFLGHRMQSANSAESGFVDKRHSSRSADEMPIRLIERGVRRCWARVAQAVRLTALATSQTIRGTEFADRCKMCHSVPGVAVGPGLTGGTLGTSKAHSMARARCARRDFTLSHSYAAPKSQQLGTRRVTACECLQHW